MKLRIYYENQIVGEDYPDREYACISTDDNIIKHNIASMLFEIQMGNEKYKVLEISKERMIIEYTTYNNEKLFALFEDIDFRLYK